MAWDVPTTATVGQVLTAAFWNAEVKGNMDYLKGGIGSYTPQIDQGASTNIAKSIIEARYTRAGDMVDVWVNLSVTGSGTSGSTITITLPVTATGHAVSSHVGVGLVYDSSATTRYQGASEVASATQVGVSYPGAFTGLVGGTPAFALANADQIRHFLRYHAA